MGPDFTDGMGTSLVCALIVAAILGIVMWEVGGWLLHHIAIGWRP